MKSCTQHVKALVESVKNVLNILLDNSLSEEKRISLAESEYKKKHDLPFLEDEKAIISTRKAQYQGMITDSKLEQIKINSLLRQILQIQVRINSQRESITSDEIQSEIDLIKEFFEIDQIKGFGSIPSLRESLYSLERKRIDYKETGSGYLDNHPKMLENARQVQLVKKALNDEVKNAIEDLRNKHHQLVAQEKEFTVATTRSKRNLGNLVKLKKI